MKKLLFLILFIALGKITLAQELNAKVQILAPNLTNANKRNLDLLRNTIRDFLNNNKWTNEVYLPQERIECNFVITINNWDGNSGYTAEAQVQSARPVFNSSYNSTLLNMSDKDFDFSYSDGQSLDFSDQNFISKLSSLLGFYAYTIIGLDNDSFGKLSGTPYYEKAQNLINVAQAAGGKGWKPSDGLRNRYWLNENLLNNAFKQLRVFIYDYHLNGLDKMQDNTTSSTKTILTFLGDLQKMDKQKLGAIFPNIYFANKAEEITNVLSIASPQDRIKAYNLLNVIDPANISKYEGLRKIN